VESPAQLPETLCRLEDAIAQQGLERTDFVDPVSLAARTALSEATVRVLLTGGCPPPDSVNDRVRARVSRLAQAHLACTGRRMSDLVMDISRQLGVSEYWARQVCDGKKVPSVELLHGLVQFFDIEDGESFFTDSADEALDRVLRRTLRTMQNPQPDPVQALLDRYGVTGAALRAHGSLTRDQLERVLEGVLRSVLPTEGDTHR